MDIFDFRIYKSRKKEFYVFWEGGLIFTYLQIRREGK